MLENKGSTAGSFWNASSSVRSIQMLLEFHGCHFEKFWVPRKQATIKNLEQTCLDDEGIFS